MLKRFKDLSWYFVWRWQVQI